MAVRTIGKGKGKVKGRLQRRLERHGITYQAVADRAGVSWHHVWRVVNEHSPHHKKSSRVVGVINDLVAEAKALRVA